MSAYQKTLTQDGAGWAGFTLVQRIEAAHLGATGPHIRISVQASSVSNASIDRVYVSQIDSAGKAYDSASDLTLVYDAAANQQQPFIVPADAFALGPCGSVRVVAGRIWLRQLAHPCSGSTMWCVWSAAAVALVICSGLAPPDRLFLGLLLGASLSHAVETSVRGGVTDYICLRAWPAFNLADLALAAGALGLIGELLIIVSGNMS